MQDRIKYVTMFLLFYVCCFGLSKEVLGYTGTGSSSNPYIITKEAELKEILTTKGGDSWKYIAVNGDITIRSSIVISKGKFRIYAKGAERMIKRSGDKADAINSGDAPKYCMVINGSANVVLGYKSGSNQTLKLGGNKANFTGNNRSSGYVYIGENASATLDSNGLLTNVKNNKSNVGGTAIFSLGSLVINGEISNCEGTDGGAVGVKNGSLEINSTANIHHCSSQTEGGGVFGISNCDITMKGGNIRNCTAKEEGGGLFVGGSSQCIIEAGSIMNNSSGLTGGGVFSGNGAMLTVGKSNGTGPVISYNKSGTVGGGIRCNGGLEDERGGTSIFYGGYVNNNTAESSVGGISCGSKGDIYESKIYLRNMSIQNNVSKGKIGGIRLPLSATGTSSEKVYITNCIISGNSAEGDCGGFMSECRVVVINSDFTNNNCKKKGGAAYVSDGVFQLDSGSISGNSSVGVGDGVYVSGEFRIGSGSSINEDNEVYLTKGTYVDVISKINKDSGLIAKINSEVNINGTKLVKVSHADGSSSEELYYYNTQKGQRYDCISMSQTQVLRPSEKVNGYEDYWIIISEKYSIQYNKNTAEQVDNMPGKQEKYWNENIVLSGNKVSRNGYLTSKKHWNNKADGSGNTFAPDSVYTGNSNLTLYAHWEKIHIQEIYINTVDRYYVVKQDIILNRDELLKKVTTDDDLHTGQKYILKITKIVNEDNENIVEGNDLLPEKYMNTDIVAKYAITLETSDEESKVSAKEIMNVYVMNTDLSNGQVRFISLQYFYTLDITSKWKNEFKNELKESLMKEDNGVFDVNLSVEKIREIKEDVKNNNYIINNTMNRNVIGKLDI